MDTNSIARSPSQVQKCGLPQPTIFPSAPPEPPQLAEIGRTESSTVIEMGSSPQQPTHSPSPKMKTETSKGARRSTPPEKLVTGVVGGLLSVTIIGITYATFQDPVSLFFHPSGPLTAGIVVSVMNLVAIVWVCSLASRATSLGALFPIIFSGLSGLMIIIYFASAQARRNFEFVNINYVAVLTFAAVFGGMGFGATVEYLITVKNEQE